MRSTFESRQPTAEIYWLFICKIRSRYFDKGIITNSEKVIRIDKEMKLSAQIMHDKIKSSSKHDIETVNYSHAPTANSSAAKIEDCTNNEIGYFNGYCELP